MFNAAPPGGTMDETYPLGDSYDVLPLEESAVTADDVLALWGRETAIPPEEARRRVHEVQLVAVNRQGAGGHLHRIPPAKRPAAAGPVALPHLRRDRRAASEPERAAGPRRARPPRAALCKRRGDPRGRDGLRSREREAAAPPQQRLLPIGRRPLHLHRREPARGPRPGPLLPRCPYPTSALGLRIPLRCESGSRGGEVLRGKSGHHRAWAVSNAHPGKPAGKCHREQTADGAATRESRTGKGERVR
jgi:hypothetical protein